jgi:predicted NUDIX family phosphoesterase
VRELHHFRPRLFYAAKVRVFADPSATPDTPMTQSERVLVFSSDLLASLGQFEGYSRHAERYLRKLCEPSNVSLVERAVAEASARYKQLIPYVVLRYEEMVFAYRRGALSNEARLRGRRSIGVGGHITSEDTEHGWSRAAYLAAARREVCEEVEVGSNYVERIVGVLNVTTDEVGRVHFGVVHLWDLERPVVRPKEDKIWDGGFVLVDVLADAPDDLETWSRATIGLLRELSSSIEDR